MEAQKQRALEIIEELCKEKNLTDFVTIASVWEGNILPGDVEERSGLILTKEGKVFPYWLEWDSEKINPNGEKGYYTLGKDFREVPREEYQSDIEYFEEMKRMGVVNRFG